MSQNVQHGAGDQSVPLSAYCIQCLTGREEKTAYLIEQAYPQITAYAVRQHKHQSTGGVKTIVTKILLPGYIFLYTRGEVPFRRLLSMQEVSWFLSYGGKDDYQLCGADLQFATWVMRHEGLFQCSRAVQVGSELKVISGPLVDSIGTVSKVDRHNRNVCLDINFDGSVRRIWLPFQWTDAQDITAFAARQDLLSG